MRRSGLKPKTLPFIRELQASTRLSDPDAGDRVRALPKVELHVHVEACLTEERIEHVAAAAGVPMLRPRGIGSRKDSRVVGIGLDVNEAVFVGTSPKFEAVFARAAELGLVSHRARGRVVGP